MTAQFLPVVIVAPGITDFAIDGSIASDGRRMIIIASLGPGGGHFPPIHPSAPFTPALDALDSALPRWTWPSTAIFAFPEHCHPDPDPSSPRSLLMSARLAS